MRISDWSSDVCSSDLALGGLEKARDGAQNCRLAAPRRPQEAEELAVFDLEVRVLDCGEFAEANRAVIELYVGAHLSRPPLVPSLPLSRAETSLTKIPAVSRLLYARCLPFCFARSYERRVGKACVGKCQ